MIFYSGIQIYRAILSIYVVMRFINVEFSQMRPHIWHLKYIIAESFIKVVTWWKYETQFINNLSLTNFSTFNF